MKLDKIIASALGASSVANGMHILDNQNQGNELGKMNSLGNKAENELVYDEMHPHKIRHPKHRNEINQHQHQMNLHEIQGYDRKHPYAAHIPKSAYDLTSPNEERELEYNRTNVALSRIERNYKRIMKRFESSHRIIARNYYKSLKQMKNIANNLKVDTSTDQAPKIPNAQMNKLAYLYDQAKTIYEDGKDNPLYTNPNAQNRKKYNNIAPSLKAIKEVVESYRKVSAQEHSHQTYSQQTHLDKMQGYGAREPEYFYELNFKERYNNFRYKLAKVNNSLADLTNDRFYCLFKFCSNKRTAELISQKQEEKNNILSEIIRERETIKWHLENVKTCHSEEVEKANRYIVKYDDLIKNADTIRLREKRDTLSQQRLSEKLSNLTTKLEENQSYKPLSSNVKQNTAIER